VVTVGPKESCTLATRLYWRSGYLKCKSHAPCACSNSVHIRVTPTCAFRNKKKQNVSLGYEKKNLWVTKWPKDPYIHMYTYIIVCMYLYTCTSENQIPGGRKFISLEIVDF